MKKIFGCLFAGLACLSITAVCAGAANSDGVILPVGDTEAFYNISIPAGEYESSDLSMTLSEDKESAGFYNYGSDYGYEDMQFRTNAEARKALYNDLEKTCRDFAQNGGDIPRQNIGGYEVYMIKYLEINSSLTTSEAYEVFFTFRNDHPEYYWLYNGTLAAYNEDTGMAVALVVMSYEDYALAETRNDLDKTIDTNLNLFVDKVDQAQTETVYDKVKLVRDLICDEVEYGYDENGDPLDTAYAHSIVGVLDGNADTNVVCEGYSKTFQLVLNALGIDNVYVIGLGDGGEGFGPHAWNMAKMDDGNYYYFDITWDDVSEGRYLANGVKSFVPTHMAYTTASTEEYFLYALPAAPDGDFKDGGNENKYFMRAGKTACGDERGIEIRLNKTIDDASVYVAGYDDNGSLMDIKKVPADGLTDFCAMDYNSYSKIKVFLWGDENSDALSVYSDILPDGQ